MARISGTAAPAVELHDAPEHLSYSQLAMLHQAYRYACARKWAYRYRLKLPEERTPSLAIGSAFDQAANTYFRLTIDGCDGLKAASQAGDAGLRHLDSEVEDHPDLFRHVKHEQPLEAYQALFMAGWAAFLAVEGNARVASVQSRHIFTVGISSDHTLPVVGYSDRLDEDGTLVDLKFSGSPRWSQDGTWHEDYVREKRDQLLIYHLARQADERRLGRPLQPPLNGRGRLVVIYHKLGLVTPQVRVRELDLKPEEDGQELLHKIVEAARLLAENRLPARPGDACRYCSYLARCREDEAARGRPWMEVVEVPF